jgi:hypothetical protein
MASVYEVPSIETATSPDKLVLLVVAAILKKPVERSDMVETPPTGMIALRDASPPRAMPAPPPIGTIPPGTSANEALTFQYGKVRGDP